MRTPHTHSYLTHPNPHHAGFGGGGAGGPFGGAQGFEFRWGGPGGAGGGAQQVDPEELFRHFEDFFTPFGAVRGHGPRAEGRVIGLGLI